MKLNLIKLALLAGVLALPACTATGPHSAIYNAALDAVMIDSNKVVFFERRLEPEGRRVFHGVGQDVETFLVYGDKMKKNKPVLLQQYAPLHHEKGPDKVKDLDQRLKDGGYPYIALQLGADIPNDRLLTPEELENTAKTWRAIKELERPVFVRIGYEFNGHWNAYDPEFYKSNWRAMAAVRDAEAVTNAALVWCYVPDGARKDYISWYPGDDCVDWWAFDPFSPKDMTSGETVRFIKDAYRRKFPVMIGESTPRWVGARQGELSWRVWFQRYFNLFDQYPHIKGFSYIAWNWKEKIEPDKSSFSWHWWGDARLWEDKYVFHQWQEEMKDARYVHATGKSGIRKAFRIDLPYDL